jgi:hypothetical protein
MKHCFLKGILAVLLLAACDHDWKYIVMYVTISYKL